MNAREKKMELIGDELCYSFFKLKKIKLKRFI